MCVLHDLKKWWFGPSSPPPSSEKADKTGEETREIIDRTLVELERRVEALQIIKERV